LVARHRLESDYLKWEEGYRRELPGFGRQVTLTTLQEDGSVVSETVLVKQGDEAQERFVQAVRTTRLTKGDHNMVDE
jgi:hypothetical protein